MTTAQLSENLKKYLPEAAVDYCVNNIVKHHIHIKIAPGRITKIGDYRPPVNYTNHRISINHNLNHYSFLITFIHELAHLTNWNKHRGRVAPHGAEWKNEFVIHTVPLIKQDIFPVDIKNALFLYMDNPAAATCTDKNLFRTLKKYDADSAYHLLEVLPQGSKFLLKGYSNTFVKGNRIRKNFLCVDLNTNRQYKVSPVAEVKILG